MFVCHRFLKFGSLLSLTALFTACALPAHNNTLIFAVKRDVAISASTPSAADTSVNVTLGYKERQAAWVPLWANEMTGGFGAKKGRDCEAGLGKSACMRSAKFVGDSDPGGKGNDAHDAYSTFASFGGAASASVNGTTTQTAQASGNLASFFATGVAAQHLAKEAASNDLTGIRAENERKNDKEKAKQASSAEIAKKLSKDIQTDAKVSLEAFFINTATYLSTHTASLTVVTPDCLTALRKGLTSTLPDLSWVKGREPDEAAEKLVFMGGMNDEQLRSLAAQANEIHAKIMNIDKTNKNEGKGLTNRALAEKGAALCKAALQETTATHRNHWPHLHLT